MHNFSNDLFKFVGHELFVILIACLMRDEHWELLDKLLKQPISVFRAPYAVSKPEDFTYASEFVMSLEIRNRQLELNRVSVHADLLKERHSDSALSKIVPFVLFMDAEFFLYLRNNNGTWYPRCGVYFSTRSYIPQFLSKAASVGYAQKLLAPLGVESIEVLRSQFIEKRRELSRVIGAASIYRPIDDFNPDDLGSIQ